MLALWGRMSARVLDLDIEWKHINNEEFTLTNLKKEARNAKGTDELSPLGLLGVCALHNISTRDQQHKEQMRHLILTGGPWTEEQERQILDYCAEDVWDTPRTVSGNVGKHSGSTLLPAKGRWDLGRSSPRAYHGSLRLDGARRNPD